MTNLMADNEALVLQALAHNVVRASEGKSALKFNGIPSNDAVEGVTYESDVAGTVHFRLCYPAAQAVVIRTPTGDLPLQKAQDGIWAGTTHCPVGFHYIFILVDGQDVLSPYVPIGYGYSRPTNYIEVPPAGELTPIQHGALEPGLAYLIRPDVPHGSVCGDFFFSSVTGRTEKLLVYLPPGYHRETSATTRFPVLYLQHGHGENENGWVFQGKVNVIADNLIHTGQAKSCIIVMGNGMVYQDDQMSYHNYCDVLIKDVVPFIDGRYRTLTDSAHRAVAGLSMGSMQAARVGVLHSDMFAYVGLFSGFLRCGWSTIGGDDSHMDVLRKDPSTFTQRNRLLFRGMGKDDPMRQHFEDDDAILQALSIDHVRILYDGAHTWQPWRVMVAEFLSRLF